MYIFQITNNIIHTFDLTQTKQALVGANQRTPPKPVCYGGSIGTFLGLSTSKPPRVFVCCGVIKT